MPIQILPPQLANQIAAGEVVERPASVVKELIENSLDAGATRIDVEIEKGGAKRILIRDNGCGVAKAQLELALSRHATSKIIDFADLENIATLGFRGEALASISSVSRLSMSSRTAEQEQAWQASAQGREMQVNLQPTAHPVGSSLEVCDLFFNTPARRKFLRTEKTEFAHIDELIKRLALSRFDVAISLKNNGKLQRQYRIARNQSQSEKRIAAVLGNPFIQHCLHLDNQHQNMRLHGWVGLPEAARGQNDQQYFYVNGRMMRDKLLQHAIRQSFAPYLAEDRYAAYVLYLELPVDQVDVNVHPAKHEVRFHQARLVHDYLVRVLSEILGKAPQLEAQTEVVPPVASGHQYRSSESIEPHSYRSNLHSAHASPRSTPAARSSSPPSSGVSEQRAYVGWLENSTDFCQNLSDNSAAPKVNESSDEPRLRALHLLEPHYLLCALAKELQVLDCQAASRQLLQLQALNQWPQGVDSVPLLLPVQLGMSETQLEAIDQHAALLKRLGFIIEVKKADQILLKQVPKLLRQANFSQLLPQFLDRMQVQAESVWQQAELLMAALFSCYNLSPPKDLSHAAALLLQLQDYPEIVASPSLWRKLDLATLMASFKND